MDSKNMFYNIYNKKSDNELKTIANSNSYSDDSKLCAIGILKERGIFSAEFDEKEKELVKKRDTRIESMIAQDKYNTGLDRFLALTVDGIFISLASWIFKLFVRLESEFIIGIVGLIGLILPYLYNILLHGKFGQTFGKMIMNIKIYDKSETKLISYEQALIRDIVPLSFLLIVQFMSFFIDTNDWHNNSDFGIMIYLTFAMMFFLTFWSILEIITMLFNSKKRALHDFIAGTVVLKVNS